MEEYIGKIINGRYELLRKLGDGGMSRVYLAHDNRLDKYWAIKCIKTSNVISGMAEIKVLRNLNHPSLPRIVDVDSDKDRVYLVMDYVDGETLGDILKKEGAIGEEKVKAWSKEILEGLIYLHSQKPPIIYRDMKPDNVMIGSDGHIKIIDFGIAREKRDEDDVKARDDTVLLGTRGYAAPEQYGGHGQSDERTDVYCLGATMYHLLTGKSPCEPPYHMYPIRYWNSELTKEMERIVLKATRADPDKRYQSSSVFLDALNNIEEDKEKKRVDILAHFSKIFLCIGIFSIALFIIFSLFAKNLEAHSYAMYLEKAERTIVYEDKLDYIHKAISLKPNDMTGYEKLIALIKDDGIFSQSEETMLLKIWDEISPHISESIRGGLSYEIGILYWYYYIYGSDNMFGVKQSVVWFQDAIAYGDDGLYDGEANCYYMLGLFCRDITSMATEGKDRGMYLEYFGNLERLMDMTDETESEWIIVESRQRIMDSLVSYDLYFREDGVDDTRIDRLKNRCKEELEAYDVDVFF